MSDLNILPPDKDIFHEKKQTSDKQKAHLAKAREAAKATIERRRQLEALEKAKEESKGKMVDLSTDEKILEKEEEERDDTPPPQRPPRKSTKKKEESEEDVELRRFQKFMKNMKTYEDMKELHRQEEEEKKKIKVSFQKDEYDHMIYLLEKEEREKELEKKNPAKVENNKQEPERVIPAQSNIRSIRGFQNAPTRRSRFGGR